MQLVRLDLGGVDEGLNIEGHITFITYMDN